MKILVGCEQSGIVRRAFAALGHDVWSVDLLPSEDMSNRHIIGDVRDYLDDGWDLLAVFHPPCTRLCNSGVRWLHEPPKRLTAGHYGADKIAAYAAMDRDERLAFMWSELRDGADLFSKCWNADIPRKGVENPVMHRHAKALIDNYSDDARQTVQPWWFGEPAFKATNFYLEGLPRLVPTNKLEPPASGTKEHAQWSGVHRASPSPDRWKERSKTYPGMAAAIASQWGGYALREAVA